MLTFFKPQIHFMFWQTLKTRYSYFRMAVENCLRDNFAFEPAVERRFWEYQRTENLRNLLNILVFGAAAFVVLLGWDIFFSYEISPLKVVGHLLVVLSLSGVAIYLRIKHHAPNRVPALFVSSILLAIIIVSGSFLISGNPVEYTASWLGLLAIGFISYGQVSISGVQIRLLNLTALLAIMLIGHMIGVEVVILGASVLLLLIFNLFCGCLQYQLEAQARRLFLKRCEAESIAEDRSLFLRQISHNLRQPLQAVSCYSSVLEATFAEKPNDPMRTIIGKLGGAIDELNNAFIHILDIANLETGKQLPLLSEVDLNVLLARMEDQFAPQAARRGLKLIIKQRRKPPFNIYTDASILSQILGNLIDNAIKYTVQGWILVETVNIGENRLKLRVLDTGIGIPEQQKTKIFDEFFRCHRNGRDTHIQGLGIGLSYVAKAVDYLPKHALKLYSRLGQGSDFQLLLPAAETAPHCVWSPNRVGDKALAGTFVFLVDDDQEVLDALSEHLSGWGCLVQKAASKSETVAALQENIRPPDLLISDFYLDNQETAHDIVELVEAEYGMLPTLILSAHALSLDLKTQLPAYAVFLRKPAGTDMLLQAIHQALAQVQSNQKNLLPVMENLA